MQCFNFLRQKIRMSKTRIITFAGVGVDEKTSQR